MVNGRGDARELQVAARTGKLQIWVPSHAQRRLLRPENSYLITGKVNQGDVVTVEFTIPAGCSGVEVSFVSYKADAPTYNANTAHQHYAKNGGQGFYGSDADNGDAGGDSCDATDVSTPPPPPPTPVGPPPGGGGGQLPPGLPPPDIIT